VEVAGGEVDEQDAEKLRKMNSSRRGSFVIFFFFEVLFVKRGLLCCGLIYLPFRKKRST